MSLHMEPLTTVKCTAEQTVLWEPTGDGEGCILYVSNGVHEPAFKVVLGPNSGSILRMMMSRNYNDAETRFQVECLEARQKEV